MAIVKRIVKGSALTYAELDNNFTELEASANSAKMFWTSRNGCVSDADLSLYSTTFGTDNTAALQAILNQASATNPIVIYWDGKYSVTGLDVKSYTTIIVLEGCGAILRDNSNRPLLTNYHWQNCITSRQDSNIKIIGGIWNANGIGSDGSYHQTRHNTTKYWANTVMSFGGVVSLHLENVDLLGSPTWTFYCVNSKTIRIKNVLCNNGSGSHDFGCDGLHFNGNCSDIDIQNVTLKNINDDAVAFNADEVINDYPAVIAYMGGNVYGAITDARVRNIFFDNCFGFGIRILSGASRVDRIFIDNVFGTTTNYWLMIDNLTNIAINNGGSGNVGSVVIKNVDVAVTTQDLMENAYAVLGCNIESFVLENYKRRDFSTNYYGIKIRDAANIKSLRMDGINWVNANGSAYAMAIIGMEGGTVDQLTINNCYFNNTYGTTASPVFIIGAGTVNRITLNNITSLGGNNIVRQTGGSINHISANLIYHDEATGLPSFYTVGTVPDIVLTNYTGRLRTGGSGTFTVTRGEGFTTAVGL